MSESGLRLVGDRQGGPGGNTGRTKYSGVPSPPCSLHIDPPTVALSGSPSIGSSGRRDDGPGWAQGAWGTRLEQDRLNRSRPGDAPVRSLRAKGLGIHQRDCALTQPGWWNQFNR